MTAATIAPAEPLDASARYDLFRDRLAQAMRIKMQTDDSWWTFAALASELDMSVGMLNWMSKGTTAAPTALYNPPASLYFRVIAWLDVPLATLGAEAPQHTTVLDVTDAIMGLDCSDSRKGLLAEVVLTIAARVE